MPNIIVGNIITGKVIGIQPYGIFVAMDKDTQGLVHISEITNGYVHDIHEYVSIGDEIKVKIISVDEEGKISLSIKDTERINEAISKNLTLNFAEQKIGFKSLEKKLPDWLKNAFEESRQK